MDDGHSRIWKECSALFGEDIILGHLPQYDDPEKGRFYELYIPEETLPKSFDDLPGRRQIIVNGFKARFHRTNIVKKNKQRLCYWIFQMFVLP